MKNTAVHRMIRKHTTIASLLLAGLILACSRNAEASCAAPANPIEAENCLPGNPPTEWDINSQGATYQLAGFTDNISYAPGETVHMRIDARNAHTVKLTIFRLGWYGGLGARLYASMTVPVIKQAPCLFQANTELMDCGNWHETASWQVPPGTVSGIFIVKMLGDTGEENQLNFIVRNDDSHSDIIMPMVDSNWQAYNHWQTISLYSPPNHRAFKVSYNRPFIIRLQPGDNRNSSVFDHEYPVIKFLERNAFNVTYFTHVDMNRRGDLLLNHRVVLLSGHDEYYSPEERNALIKARDSGVNMAFMTANEISWKTRWEPSIDGSSTPFRTMVCYKEDSAPHDPLDPPVWTGLWSFPPKRAVDVPPGGLPSTMITGNTSCVGPVPVQDWTMKVSQSDGRLRFWRNTSAASLPAGGLAQYQEMLGYEWDCDFQNGFRNLAEFRLSDTVVNFDPPAGDTARHNMTMYKDIHGALVWSTGTMQWAWSLDPYHNRGTKFPPVRDIEQATINILADMGVAPANLQPGLVAASPSTDVTPPTCTVTSPNPAIAAANRTVSVSGTAQDTGGGVVAGVIVSLNGGTTWSRANGRENWTFSGNSGAGGNILCRAVDDSGNLQGRPISTPTNVPNPAPALGALDPRSVKPGSADFTLTVLGANFVASSQIMWNGNPLPTTFINATKLQATIPAAFVTKELTSQIMVVSPAPGGGQAGPLTFVVSNVAPVVAGSDPFPNPWDVSRNPPPVITFANLQDGSAVKIFTVSGHWVRTLTASGGIAFWDLKNDHGQNVASGYYLFVSKDPNGGRQRGKLAIIR